MEIITKSLRETKNLAKDIVSQITSSKTATILALFGDLGSGKTSFTQGLAEALGVTETITSPTFVIEKIYDLPAGQNFAKLIHIDVYRLSSGEELAKLGFADIVSDPNNLIVIEWPELVADILPITVLPINFTFINDQTRSIKYGD
ncbi:MAG: tRNA (adenosine(37)-N6)-threonylcarbamoyltransferase complex ATPase subunit type 1 TsaE [Patescibacteria group bacterium]